MSATALIGLFLLIALVFSKFSAQEPQPTPTPSPAASPSASPTPTPRRAPSPTPLPGAQNFHQWGSVTVFNGLPSDSVRAIAQTLDGVMWFGTDNGLSRFDGRRVQNYSPGGFETNRILTLKTAPTSELWVGTPAGAYVYFDSRFQLVEGTKDVGVTAVLVGREVFLGTDAGKVFRVSSDGSVFSASAVFSDPLVSSDGTPLSITGLIEAEGKLLASTSGGGVFVVADGKASEFATSPRPLFVNSLEQDGDGRLWLGSDAATRFSGIYRTDPGSRVSRITAATANVLALESNESGLWAGTERFGLFHLVESKEKKVYTFENTSGGLRSNTVFTLFTDREGVLWIGTNRGVSRFDRLGASQETVSDTANGNFIRTLFKLGDNQTLAGTNRGLFLSDGKVWKPLPGFDGKAVYSLAEHRNTELMIGTATGLYDYGGKLVYTGDIRSFANFRSRTYAVIHGRGVVQIPAPGSAGTPPPAIAPDLSVTSICEGSDRLWIGSSDKGLFSFDGQSVRSEIAPDLLKSGTIWKMFSAADGTLWIAGQHGVFRVRNGSVEKIIDAEEVRDVFVDGGQVWAATTTRGLLQARYDERFGWLVSALGFEQGLPSEKAFSILPSKDGLLVATNRGLVTYRRGSVEPKLIPTRILSQRAHDLTEIRSAIALDHPQNSLLIEVAGQSSRTFPEEFQYAFVLKNAKGAEVDRRISNESEYTATELTSGEYVVEAIAFNRDLLASEPLTIRFSVAKAPFPWTATALGILLVIALVGLLLAFVANRRILIRNRELAAARLDLANEAERERRRIARDLHDQTLADLRSLILLSDNSKIAGFRDEIESISGEVRRICEDLSPSVLENVGLVAALEFLLDRTIGDHLFTAKEDLEESLQFPMHIQLQIYRIAQEVLTNIKIHSDADKVEMELDDRDDAFFMLVSDNGSAFRPEDKAGVGRGIANIKARASMIGATVDWAENGNRFMLRIPK